MDSPGKNPGVGCHTLLQGIFLTQGSNPSLLHLLHCSRFFTAEPPGKPKKDLSNYHQLHWMDGLMGGWNPISSNVLGQLPKGRKIEGKLA